MSHFARLLGLGTLALIACTNSASNSGNAITKSNANGLSPDHAAQTSLAELDTRIAVPLLPMMANHQKENMRDHLLVVQEIILAAAREDFAGVERAATRIGYSPLMGQMCTHMGAGVRGFTEQALAFHHTADAIGAAAQ